LVWNTLLGKGKLKKFIPHALIQTINGQDKHQWPVLTCVGVDGEGAARIA
jgi:hypothetical protein